MSATKPLYLETPLAYSKHISAALGANVYLKLDVLQPSHSFKYRGISHFVQKAIEKRGPRVHLVAASGGNAGLATACVGKALGLRCTIFLPQGASASTLAFFKMEGADVREVGNCYQDALGAAEELANSDEHAVLVPAYDNSLLWEGHASMIWESSTQLPIGVKPDAVVCCVGGAGLAGGVIKGCKDVGWDDVPLITMETLGSNCFYQSLSLNAGPFPSSPLAPKEGVEVVHDETYDVNFAKLPKLNSRASSLGASWPSPGVVKMALSRKGGVKSVCVSDEMAMQTSVLFADHHKIMVELACAATLVPAYSRELFEKLVPQKPSGEPRTIVFIVCGGFKVSIEELAEYTNILAAEKSPYWEVLCNGERWEVAKQ